MVVVDGVIIVVVEKIVVCIPWLCFLLSLGLECEWCKMLSLSSVGDY